MPFAFGLLRYVETRTDLRYVWTTLVSFAGAELVIRVGGSAAALKHPVSLAGAVLASSSAAAFATGYIVGARNIVSMLIVSLSFGGCFAVGALLRAMSAQRA